MTTEPRRRRAQWSGWPKRMIEEHGRPALVGMCGGMRVLMLTQGVPAKVLGHLGPQQPTELALDEGGVYVATPDRSGWPAAGTYVDGFEIQCQIHEGHPVNAELLLQEWMVIDRSMPTTRVVRLADVEPRPRANM